MQLTSVLSLLLLGATGAYPAEPAAFCDVVSNPSRFEHRRIALTAYVESDGIHGIVLNERACKGALNVDVSGAGESLERFNDVLYSGGPGTSDKVLRARWTGHLDLSEAVPRLIVESIDEVSRGVLALAAPSSPSLHCVTEHGAWCALDGTREQALASASGTSAFRLSDPSQSDASLIVISPLSCDRGLADQLSFLSFEHGLKRYGQEWEKVGVRLRNDGTCDLQILLPQFSSNPFEWAFSSGLQLIRACKSDACEGAPVGLLKPAFELRYRSAALPIARPEVMREDGRFPMTASLEPAESPAESVAFCDVLGQPTLFKKRRISFVAHLESDGIHAVVLLDPSCKGGVTIDLSHAAGAWKPVEDALFTAGPGTSDKTITARWTGSLDLSGEARGEAPSLVVESIGELNITPIDGVPGR